MRTEPPSCKWLLAALLALGSAACGRAESTPVQWVDLAEVGDGVAPAVEDPGSLELDGRRFTFVRDEQGAWLRGRFRWDDWRMGEVPGLWKSRLPVRVVAGSEDDAPSVRVSDERGAFEEGGTDSLRAGLSTLPGAASGEAPRSFAVFEEHLYIQLRPEDGPAEETTVDVSLPRSVVEDGLARVHGTRFSGVGLTVLPGSRVERVVDLPPRSALRFATCIDPSGVRKAQGELTFRVLVDGAPVLEHTQAFDRKGSYRWHELPLQPAGAEGANVTFEVEGDFVHSSFLTPRIGPLDVGRPGARPWGAGRPDIVVFLADTFRADNMATYGGELDLTPNLDRFAADCRRFLRAWSPATHTLPAHAALFSGLHPLQTGIVGHATRVPEDVRMIAESLETHGYRTAAITDKGFLSRVFGMAQGFEFFDEHRADIQSTLGRARDVLEADDGRPLFLFVQTYRVHTPYLTSARTREERGAELGIDAAYEDLHLELLSETGEGGHLAESEEARALVDSLRSLYHGGVVDLDRRFGMFLSTLRTRGFLEHGYLLFTSDHGEAFLEHGDVFHSGPVFEEEVRIPLLLHGPDIEPGASEYAASLTDVAPTLLSLAGIDSSGERYGGRSLLELDGERPVFLFQCHAEQERSTVGIVLGSQKLITSEAWLRTNTIGQAYDLAADPGEHRDLVPEGAAWPDEFFSRFAPIALELCQPLHALEQPSIDAEHQAQMQALGYMGE